MVDTSPISTQRSLPQSAAAGLARLSSRRLRRTAAQCTCVADFRDAAARRWPRGLFDFVEGGADDELSVARNVAAFAGYEWRPSVLRGRGDISTEVELFGCLSARPFALAPTGYTRAVHPDGEIGAARAAQELGIPFTLSTMGSVSIEDLALCAPGNLWFQLYVWRRRAVSDDLIDRAAVCGYKVLMVTVDAPVTGMRRRDWRNGFTQPPSLTWTTVREALGRPRWYLTALASPSVTFANLPPEFASRRANVATFAARNFDSEIGWDTLAAIRRRWPGFLVLKGVLNPADAVRARDVGVDGIVLSNHGGRQLDQTVPPIHAVRAVRAAVGDSFDLIVDSGVRHGGHVAMAVALGASGCLVGRPYLYGLGVGGQAGCLQVLSILSEEFERTMALLGVRDVDELRARGRSLVNRRCPCDEGTD